MSYQNLLPSENLVLSLTLLIIVIGCTLLGIFLNWILFKFVAHEVRKKPNNIWCFIEQLKKPFYIFLPLLLIKYVLSYIDLGTVEHTFTVFLRIAIVLVISWMALRTISFINHWFSTRYNIYTVSLDKEKRIITKFYFLKRIVIIGIVLVATALILMNFENAKEVGKWVLTSAGLAGAIVAFAAQKSLANIIFGLQLAFTESLKIGDFIVVENEVGTVEEVSLTYVIVRLWDLRRLILPLSYFNEKPFQNWTHTSSDLIGTVFIYTDYNVDVEKLKEELKKIAESTPLWDKKVCILQISDLKENSVELRVLISARNPAELWDIRCYVREKMIQFIQKRFPESLPKMRTKISIDPNQLGQNIGNQ